MGSRPTKHSIAVVGLDGAGKSAASESIRTYSGQLDGNIVPPTDDGVRLVEAKFEGQEWTMWDLSGRSKFRLLWDGFLQQVDAAILVVDCSDVHRLAVNRDAAQQVAASLPAHAPILVLANKRAPCRVSESAGSEEASKARQLTKEEVMRVVQSDGLLAKGRPVHVVQVNALTGDGLDGAVGWLADKFSQVPGV